MKAICKTSLLAAAGFILATLANAQTAPDSPVKVRFRLMSWDAPITDLNYAQGKKIIPVGMLPNGRSSFYNYEGSDALTFFREVTGPDGKPAAEVAASVPLSDFKERTLLLFFRSSVNPKEYRVQLVDDSDAAIPPGSYHFFNLTQFPLKVKCGSGEAEVPAHREETVLGTPTVQGQTLAMQVDVITAAGLRHAYSNLLPYGKTTRSLVFVSPTPENRSFEVKRLQEDAATLPKPSPGPRS